MSNLFIFIGDFRFNHLSSCIKIGNKIELNLITLIFKILSKKKARVINCRRATFDKR